MEDQNDFDLTEKEIEALHHLQLGKEDIKKARGYLMDFHHEIGSGMNHYKKAHELLEEVDRDKSADEISEMVPRDVIEGYWSWKLVEEFESHFYDPVSDAEESVRDRMADGEEHINEQIMEKDRKRKFWD